MPTTFSRQDAHKFKGGGGEIIIITADSKKTSFSRASTIKLFTPVIIYQILGECPISGVPLWAPLG